MGKSNRVTTEEYRRFRAAYKKYALLCEAATNILLARIANLKIGMQYSESRELIDTVTSRIKTAESAENKLINGGYELTIENVKEHVRDVAGVRIITPFVDDIYVIADALQNQNGLNVRRVKDYIEGPDSKRFAQYVRCGWTRFGPKESGYKSLHLTIEVEINFIDGKYCIPVEVQIRDKTMDAWAAIEHICGYKCTDKSPKAKELFQRASAGLSGLSDMVIELRDYESPEE